jgi:hypothetical protein
MDKRNRKMKVPGNYPGQDGDNYLSWKEVIGLGNQIRE